MASDGLFRLSNRTKGTFWRSVFHLVLGSVSSLYCEGLVHLNSHLSQVKKVKKWSCKMCGEKQSVFEEFGRGTGADCRRHVQKLNATRGQMEQDQVTGLLRQRRAVGTNTC